MRVLSVDTCHTHTHTHTGTSIYRHVHKYIFILRARKHVVHTSTNTQCTERPMQTKRNTRQMPKTNTKNTSSNTTRDTPRKTNYIDIHIHDKQTHTQTHTLMTEQQQVSCFALVFVWFSKQDSPENSPRFTSISGTSKNTARRSVAWSFLNTFPMTLP